MATQKRGALGTNPLSQGIFTKTTEPELNGSTKPVETTSATETIPTVPEVKTHEVKAVSRKKKEESRILIEERTEKVNLRLSIETNDWLDELLKRGRRQHGHKIPKEVWVQAALELFRAMPIDWEQIESEEALKDTLFILESRIKNQENLNL